MFDYSEICLEEEKSQNIAIERGNLGAIYKSKREMVCSTGRKSGRLSSRLLREWVKNLCRVIQSTRQEIYSTSKMTSVKGHLNR